MSRDVTIAGRRIGSDHPPLRHPPRRCGTAARGVRGAQGRRDRRERPYIPVHIQPCYREQGFAPGDFPQTERYCAGAISLPLYPTMTGEQQDTVVSALKRVLE